MFKKADVTKNVAFDAETGIPAFIVDPNIDPADANERLLQFKDANPNYDVAAMYKGLGIPNPFEGTPANHEDTGGYPAYFASLLNEWGYLKDKFNYNVLKPYLTANANLTKGIISGGLTAAMLGSIWLANRKKTKKASDSSQKEFALERDKKNNLIPLHTVFTRPFIPSMAAAYGLYPVTGGLLGGLGGFVGGSLLNRLVNKAFDLPEFYAADKVVGTAAGIGATLGAGLAGWKGYSSRDKAIEINKKLDNDIELAKKMEELYYIQKGYPGAWHAISKLPFLYAGKIHNLMQNLQIDYHNDKARKAFLENLNMPKQASDIGEIAAGAVGGGAIAAGLTWLLMRQKTKSLSKELDRTQEEFAQESSILGGNHGYLESLLNKKQKKDFENFLANWQEGDQDQWIERHPTFAHTVYNTLKYPNNDKMNEPIMKNIILHNATNRMIDQPIYLPEHKAEIKERLKSKYDKYVTPTTPVPTPLKLNDGTVVLPYIVDRSKEAFLAKKVDKMSPATIKKANEFLNQNRQIKKAQEPVVITKKRVPSKLLAYGNYPLVGGTLAGSILGGVGLGVGANIGHSLGEAQDNALAGLIAGGGLGLLGGGLAGGLIGRRQRSNAMAENEKLEKQLAALEAQNIPHYVQEEIPGKALAYLNYPWLAGNIPPWPLTAPIGAIIGGLQRGAAKKRNQEAKEEFYRNQPKQAGLAKHIKKAKELGFLKNADRSWGQWLAGLGENEVPKYKMPDNSHLPVDTSVNGAFRRNPQNYVEPNNNPPAAAGKMGPQPDFWNNQAKPWLNQAGNWLKDYWPYLAIGGAGLGTLYNLLGGEDEDEMYKKPSWGRQAMKWGIPAALGAAGLYGMNANTINPYLQQGWNHVQQGLQSAFGGH
jgi:hypothetical protein